MRLSTLGEELSRVQCLPLTRFQSEGDCPAVSQKLAVLRHGALPSRRAQQHRQLTQGEISGLRVKMPLIQEDLTPAATALTNRFYLLAHTRRADLLSLPRRVRELGHVETFDAPLEW